MFELPGVTQGRQHSYMLTVLRWVLEDLGHPVIALTLLPGWLCLLCVSLPSPIMEERSSNVELWVNIGCKYEHENGCIRVKPAYHGCVNFTAWSNTVSVEDLPVCRIRAHHGCFLDYGFSELPASLFCSSLVDHLCWTSLPAKSVNNILTLKIIIYIFKALCKHKLIEESLSTKKSQFCLFGF